MGKKILFISWIIASVIISLYSFTQVDLSLTLSRLSIWQEIQKFFQYIGYFQRPLSTYIFSFAVIFIFSLFLWTLKLIKLGKLQRREVWTIILTVSAILFLSYNAFSYDLFNYIFDAKIITYYNQNPYVHKAVDFPGDPMLSFMHWTHRTYPYGPVWLILTVPFSFIGLNYFLLTFYLFKLLVLSSFIGSAYFIEKVLIKTKSVNPLFGLAFFALNPLILTESLVSAHNDIVMMFFAILSVYLLLEKKLFYSFLALALSIGIKFATVFLIPVYIYYLLSNRNKENYKQFFYLSFVSMIIPVILACLRTNFQPWYLLYALPFAAYISKSYFIFIPVIIFSILSIFQYAPFIYLGNWDKPVPQVLSFMNIIAIGSSFLTVLILFLKGVFLKKYVKKS